MSIAFSELEAALLSHWRQTEATSTCATTFLNPFLKTKKKCLLNLMRNPGAQLRLPELQSYQTVWTQSAVSIFRL